MTTWSVDNITKLQKSLYNQGGLSVGSLVGEAKDYIITFLLKVEEKLLQDNVDLKDIEEILNHVATSIILGTDELCNSMTSDDGETIWNSTASILDKNDVRQFVTTSPIAIKINNTFIEIRSMQSIS